MLARGARARRYVFDFDEVAEAEAQGLPYVLAPRVLSRQEWIDYEVGRARDGRSKAVNLRLVHPERRNGRRGAEL